MDGDQGDVVFSVVFRSLTLRPKGMNYISLAKGDHMSKSSLFILLFFAVLSFRSEQACADLVDDLIHLRLNGHRQNSLTRDLFIARVTGSVPAKPIKNMNVTYFVDKFWNEKISDNNFQKKDEHVCTKTISMPAYDPASNWFDAPEFFDTCETTLDSLKQGITYKTTVHLGGLLFIDPKKDNEKNFVPEVNIELSPNNTTDAAMLMVGQVRGKFDSVLTHLHDFSGSFYQAQKIYVGVFISD